MKKVGEISLHSPISLAGLVAEYLILNIMCFFILVVFDLRQLCDICVHEERVRYLGKGYLLMLRLAAGISYPLTQSATVGGRR